MNFTRSAKSHLLFKNQTFEQAPRSCNLSQKAPWFALRSLETIPPCNWVHMDGGGAALRNSASPAAETTGEEVGKALWLTKGLI
jgi:hypothetical protein